MGSKSPSTNRHDLSTESSRPYSHPDQLTKEEAQAILLYRYQYRRCAEVIHHYLVKDGYSVSLSSVKRTLKRQGLISPSKWKKWHQYSPRPIPEKPGILVQIDTMPSGQSPDCLRAYALIDVCSRWVYATPVARANTWNSWRTTKQALRLAPFKIQALQSDQGCEFLKWYTKQLSALQLQHRHSRVRKPTDNSHIERFMRTLQQECLKKIP